MCQRQVVVLLIAVVVGISLYVFEPVYNEYGRLTPMPEEILTINNNIYNEDYYSNSWWDVEGWASGLHKMNTLRVDYFHNIFTNNLINLKSTSTDPTQLLIADLGCGGGLVTENMGKLGWNVIGIDISTKSIETARKHLQELKSQIYIYENINVTYVEASVLKLPFADNTLDGVIMSDVLEHINDLPTLFSELKRTVKPGGVFVFDTINRNLKSYIAVILIAESLTLIPSHCHDYRLFVRPEELELLLDNKGITLKEIKGLEVTVNVMNLLKRGKLNFIHESFKISDDLTQYIGYAVKK